MQWCLPGALQAKYGSLIKSLSGMYGGGQGGCLCLVQARCGFLPGKKADVGVCRAVLDVSLTLLSIFDDV